MIFWTKFEKYENERSRLKLNKDRAVRRRTKRTQENINLLQEKLIENPRISARMIDLNISKSTFNRIAMGDLKWHPNEMNVKRFRKNKNEFELLKANQDSRMVKWN